MSRVRRAMHGALPQMLLHLSPGLVPELLDLLCSARDLYGVVTWPSTFLCDVHEAHLWSVVKVSLSELGRKPRKTMNRFAGLLFFLLGVKHGLERAQTGVSAMTSALLTHT